MSDALAEAKSERLTSLDVIRGITIAGMILVNNAGNWDGIYGPLRHVSWNGWTPTDLVFPSFLFIVGVAMTFSFDKRLAAGFSRRRLFEQVVRRTMILFLLGLIIGLTPFKFPNWRLIAPYIVAIVGLGFLFADEPPLGWPIRLLAQVRKTFGWALLAGAVVYFAIDFGYFQKSELRIPGVLQRIALCYFAASIITLYSGIRGRVLWMLLFLLGYWALVAWSPSTHAPRLPAVAASSAPVSTRPAGTPQTTGRPPLASDRPEAALHDEIDCKLLGSHLYARERPDPEGLLSTIPAIATVLFGVLAGNWLQSRRDRTDKAFGLFLVANVVLFAGLWMNLALPINKKIWTSSYVLFAGGISLHALAMCYYLIDIKGYRRWAWPFLVFGTNAIVVFFASGVLARLMNLWVLPSIDGRSVTRGIPVGTVLRTWGHQTLDPAWVPAEFGPKAIMLKTWLYQTLFASWTGPRLSSLLFALAYVILWLLLLAPLYRKRIFIRV